MYRIGILISGRGSNMLALVEACAMARIPGALVAVVISDHQDAPGLKHAVEQGIAARAIERRGRTRLEHDGEIITALQEYAVDLVCLAGYMRLLSHAFIEAYPYRILNIHPSLLPSFPGLEPHRQAIEHGVKWSGCTVHFVDETLDGGPIIMQTPVPIADEDTPASLAARILVEEHKLYAEAVSLILSGEYEIVGRRVRKRPTPA
jgi:phosphoribosylglycinamide formyltransferase-1